MQYTCPHCSREFDVAEGSPAPTQCPLCARPVQIQSPPPLEPVPGGPVQSCGLATASLILGILACVIHILVFEILAIVFGVKARKAIAKSAGRMKGAGMALAGMILGIVNLALIPIIVAIMVPALMGAKELAGRARSAANLNQIGKGLAVYSTEQEGRFPPNLQALVEEGYITEEILKNPRRQEHAPDGDYAYVVGLKRDARPDFIIAYEKTEGHHHSDGLNVLFLDSRVQWMKPEKFQQRLDKTKKWLTERHGPPND